jgi:hypothetical protein
MHLQDNDCKNMPARDDKYTKGPPLQAHVTSLASHHSDQPYIQPHARNGAVATGRCQMPIQMLAGDCGPVTVPRHCPVLPD